MTGLFAVVLAFLSFAPSAYADAERPGTLFPPIERLLGAIDQPTTEDLDLRDSLASKPSLDWFVRSLRAKDPDDRRSAVNALGTTGRVQAVPYLGAVLENLNEETLVRVAAATALGRVGSPLSRDYLANGLKAPVVDVRFAAALALGRVNPTGAVSILTNTLKADPHWWVRYAAAMALGKTRQGFAVDALERAAREDGQWQGRLQAAQSLGEVRTDRAAAALGGAMHDDDDGVRAAVVMALGDCGGQISLELLTDALRIEPDAFLRNLMGAAVRKVLAAPLTN